MEPLAEFWRNAQVFIPDPIPKKFREIGSTLQRYIENARLAYCE